MNMWRIAFGGRQEPRQTTPTSHFIKEDKIAQRSCPVKTSSSKYVEDIAALQEAYGDLNGRELRLNLKEALDLCPRNRKRVEAYMGLRSHLAKAFNCKLTIISKRKKTMRKPKIFMMGEVYDLNTITKEELQKKLQEKINSFGFPGQCKVVVTDNEDDGFDDIYYMIGVRRGYGIDRWIYIRLDEEGYLLEGDANIITGNTHGYVLTDELPKSEFLKDFSGQHSIQESEFSEAYNRICKKEGADVPEDTEFVQSEHGYFQWIISY